VRGTRPNASFSSILEDYLRNNPDKRRNEEDIRAARAIFKPGEAIVTGGAVVNATSLPSATAAAPSPPPRQPQRPTISRQPFHLDPSEFPRSTGLEDFLGPRFGFGADPHQRLIEQFLSPVFVNRPRPPPRTAPNYVLRTPGQPNTIADIITRNRRSAEIQCDWCSHNINTSVHYECTVCSLYHLCSPCYRSGKTCPAQHPMLAQKQVYGLHLPHLETGLFCDICEEWVDSSGGGFLREQNAFFWRCAGGCNNGNWHYCMRCVRLGSCCDHELKLYTNNRLFPPINAVVRGPLPQQQPAGPTLESRGYMRWREYQVTCNRCNGNVICAASEAWYHCRECFDGEFDVCMPCSARLAVEGECLRGHMMTIMSRGSEGPGSVRTLLRPAIDPPEMCGDVEPRTAVAVRGNLMGSEVALKFPVGAELREVRPVIDDEWCWGTYCGRGGIFERSLVRLT
jgi:hypothetical protein